MTTDLNTILNELEALEVELEKLLADRNDATIRTWASYPDESMTAKENKLAMKIGYLRQIGRRKLPEYLR